MAAKSVVPASPASSRPSGVVTAPADAVDTAIQLEQLLGQHAVLVSDMMRARIRVDRDLAQAASAALSQNSTSLGAVLGPVVGAQAAARFAELWAAHIQGFYAYAGALGAHDAAARVAARKELVEYENLIAGFFVAGSHGRLSRPAALAAIREHVDHLLQGADAFAAKDYPRSAALYRTSYIHTFDLGATLATTLAPAAVAKTLATPSSQLRTALTRLLTEHVALVIAAMRASAGDPADLAAMGTALNGNTQDIAAAMESLYGASAAQRFESLWADHVDQLLAYTRATVAGDAAGQERARLELRSFESDFATFLNTATQNRLGQPTLAQAFVMHDRELLAEIDAYHAGSYAQAHDLTTQTYAHMAALASQLATAIGATAAAKLPSGGSQTGGGGMAAVVGGR